MNPPRAFLLASLTVLIVASLSASACSPQLSARPVPSGLVAELATGQPFPHPQAPTNTPLIEPAALPAAPSTPRTASAATPPPTQPPVPPAAQPAPQSPAPTSPPLLLPASGAVAGSNPIAAENQKPGTTDWLQGPGYDDYNVYSEIAGFADAVSVNVGGTVHFAISTRSAGLGYSLSIYRMGWYNGDGARLMLAETGLKGQAQGYWDSKSGGVRDCSTCEFDPQTGLLDTHWQSSYTLTVPADWISGDYIIKLVTEQGHTAYINFIVRDDNRRSDVLVQIPTNTDQAYNTWGGKSLYWFNSSGQRTVSGGAWAVKVSFNRPITSMHPSLIVRPVQAVRFFERNGYDVTYTTNTDVDANPASLRQHRAFISVGHDEYWTGGNRDAAEQARDAGVHLAFFGGNDVYWQARFEADRDGTARRTLVVYRVAAIDPLASTDPSRTTVRWVSPPLNRPQNSLTGTIYGSQASGASAAWVVAPTAPQSLLAGTGLQPGSSVPKLIGGECDVAVNNGHQPAGLVVVAVSPINNINHGTTLCNSTWYQAASGAYVFSGGCTNWTFGLDNFAQAVPGAADSRLQKLVQNVLAAFGVKAATPAGP